MRVIPVFRLVMFLFAAFVLAACGGGQAAAPTPGSNATAAPDATAPAVATAPAAATVAPIASINRGKGDPNAPVIVIEYSDFQ